MVQLQSDLEQLANAGLQVAGVSYDSVDILKKFSDAKGISFPLLSDEGSETIKAYGLHNKDGLPHPGTVVVGKDGVIRAKLFLDGYRDRHANEELLQAAVELD